MKKYIMLKLYYATNDSFTGDFILTKLKIKSL